MTTPLEQLRWERRRKLQVRESFSQALGHFGSAGGDPARFYLACADYLVSGQQRLLDQDQRLVDMLAPRVPATQEDDHRAMAALRQRLAVGAAALEEFSAAAQRYREVGATGRGGFEAAASRFLDVLVNVLGAKSHSLRHLTTTVFSDDDWRRIVGITPEFLEEEASAFAAVCAAAPAGMSPELMAAAGRPERPEPAGRRTS